MHVPYSLKEYLMALDIRIFPLTIVGLLRGGGESVIA
jgi:hypothetical protein